MDFSLKGFLYRLFVDPLTGGSRRRVAEMIRPGETVLDVACGTGAMAVAISRHADHVTGIDLDEEMIITANRLARKKDIKNISFELRDATDLSCYSDKQFDIAVTSLAMHQFEPAAGVKVLSEMGRISKRVIITDYNCPMTPGPAARLAWAIEHAAGGDHYSNFRQYMARGGISRMAKEAAILITGNEVRGKGVFVIVQGAGQR